jgi:hypothetical protein
MSKKPHKCHVTTVITSIFVSKKCNVVYIMVNDLSRRDDATTVHLP